MKKELEELKREHRKAQEFITDILSYKAGEKVLDDGVGPNPYRSREKLVSALTEKYKGYARWGNQLVQRIVDTRAAFALGRGVKAVPAAPEDGTAELEFLKSFISYNRLDGDFAQQLGVQKELEGQVLLKLSPVFDGARIPMTAVSVISWNDTHYEVVYSDFTCREIERVKWRDKVTGITIRLEPDELVFMKFNAPANSPEGVPTLSGLLVECEDIDRALRDWRTINRFFASPTPYFKTEDMAQAKDLYEQLSDPSLDWRVGKVFTGPADFSLVGMTDSGAQSLKLEIETKLKILAGGAGVPVQFLGFPEFMSNRATAENTMEPVEAVALQERQVWKAGLRELFDKAVRMRNEFAPATEAPLKEGAVLPEIPFATQSRIERLAKLYLPAFQAGAIDHKTFLSLLPDTDD